MANEQIFNHRAENYSLGRPGYADEVTKLIFDKILKPKDKIADIGSGTGIFSRLFIERGFDVYCVEPNSEMRMQAENAFHGNPHFISVTATAENTGLPEHSVDLITVASAFHWFDAEKFQRECQRILKPHGFLFTVANSRDYNDLFTLRQHEISQKYCNNFTSFRHGLNKSIPRLEKIFGDNMNYAEYDYPLEYEKEKFIARCLSSSYAPEADTDECKNYVKELWRLMDEFAPNMDTIIIPNVSVACWGVF